ncbi:MAG: FecR domain-containing protein [Tannerellaceae bacterium]|jgi:hypothetical protein|nr:FecR domain-containing protein [Tannerellaceae bacterium]
MTIRNDKHYTLVELLDDAYFILSVKNPTLESDMFWKDAIKKGYLTPETYALANDFILSVQPKELDKNQKAEIWDNIRKRNIKRQRKKADRWIFVSAIAACLTALTILSVNYFHPTENPYKEMLVSIEKPDTAVNAIQIIFPDSKPLIIKNKNANIQYTGEGTILVDSEVSENEKQTPTVSDISGKNKTNAYNQLIIPKGQQSSLILSDGTKIWLNAGTRIVYPPVFNKAERVVYVEGEVFLNVSPDSKRPFIVKTKEFDIQVTGTSFNVSSYEDMEEYSVVLVGGSVKIKSKELKEEITLVPNQKLSRLRSKYNIETVNATEYTAWINGFYQYKGEKIAKVIQKLSYYYNYNIYCDEEIARKTCSGKLDLKQDIEKVLDTLCRGSVPMIYQKDGNNYYIRSLD